jgi:hypothetical protein
VHVHDVHVHESVRSSVMPCQYPRMIGHKL